MLVKVRFFISYIRSRVYNPRRVVNFFMVIFYVNVHTKHFPIFTPSKFL